MKLSFTLISLFGSGIFAFPRPNAGGRFLEHIKSRFVEEGEDELAAAVSPDNIHSHVVMDKSGDDLSAVEYSSNWGGAVIKNPPLGTTFQEVSATWTIPAVARPSTSTGAGTWYTAEWVGIDGYNYDSAILQAGILSAVTVAADNTSSTVVQAWYEWYPLDLYYFNLTVATGDSVFVSVYANTSTTGTVIVENLTSGNSTSIFLTAPSASNALAGRNAEWIVEDISSGLLVPFAQFDTVIFTGAQAVTKRGGLKDLSDATLVDMNQTTLLTTAVVLSDSELEVSYV